MPKPTSTRASDLSELEGGVLGIVQTCPGSTAHAIRERFRRSRSSHWSGSAGAIYPLMKKLHGRGLLEVRESPRGERTRSEYTITPAGVRELRRWLGPPVPEWVAAVTFDPLRTRMPFLGALSAAKQEAFLVEAEELLVAELQVLRKARAEMEGSEPFWELMSADGCLSNTQARLRWVRKTLEAFRAQ